MENLRTSPREFSVEDLDRELLARGARKLDEKWFDSSGAVEDSEREEMMKQVKKIYHAAKSWPKNEALKDIDDEDLIIMLLFKTGQMEIDDNRGIWGKEKRLDIFEIDDKEDGKRIKNNANCIAAVMSDNSWSETNKNFSELKFKTFQETFNLSDNESFHYQPTAAGRIGTGFLVKEDVIATAAHCARAGNVTDLLFVFGFKMAEPDRAVTKIPKDNIYKGAELIRSAYDQRYIGKDWALIKLDRKVVGRTILELSRDDICGARDVYVLGHPCGLPLKYAPGAQIRDVNKSWFGANLDIYQGNSGSPVFDSETHKVIGMVAKGDTRDFRWTKGGWVSVIYPNRKFYSPGSRCVRVSEFINIIHDK